jgi:hypothetical protein
MRRWPLRWVISLGTAAGLLRNPGQHKIINVAMLFLEKLWSVRAVLLCFSKKRCHAAADGRNVTAR